MIVEVIHFLICTLSMNPSRMFFFFQFRDVGTKAIFWDHGVEIIFIPYLIKIVVDYS